MGNVQWNGLNSNEMTSSLCPYNVELECTPVPAETLNSLESGRLMLTIKLQRSNNTDENRTEKEQKEEEIMAVFVRMFNRAKQANLHNIEGSSELKRKTSLLANLARDDHRSGYWTGMIGIPVTWMEGGTTDFERSGSWHPKSNGNLFAMEITYTMDDGRKCTIHFESEDVYHWGAKYSK